VHPRNGRNRTIADELCSLYVNRVLPRALRGGRSSHASLIESGIRLAAQTTRVSLMKRASARVGKKIRINAMQMAGGVREARRRKV